LKIDVKRSSLSLTWY